MMAGRVVSRTLVLTTAFAALAGTDAARGITPELPFYENFEPSPDHWNWLAEWYAYDHPGNRTTYIEDPVLLPCTYPTQNCSDVWGPYKFESWPDAANGGTVYSGQRSGRQPLQDPYWHAILHPFTPPTGVGGLRLKVWQHDFADILCDCDEEAIRNHPDYRDYVCDCASSDPPPLPSRPNFDVHGWLVLSDPMRTEYYALAINSKESWDHVVWATKTDGWVVSSLPRTSGWHKMEILVHPYTGGVGDVEFIVDDNVIGLGRRAPGSGNGIDVSWLRLGGDPALLSEGILTNTFEVFWYDEVELTFEDLPCPAQPMDADDDGDVDHHDFARFQLCFTGADAPPEAYDALACHCFDTDDDDDIDGDDYVVFEACASGPGVPGDSDCDTPSP